MVHRGDAGRRGRDRRACRGWTGARRLVRTTGGSVSQPIRVFVTGGTFDKEYDELRGRLYFKDTHIGEMLRLARCRLEVTTRTLMMIDSLDMKDDDRRLVVE